MEKKNRLEKIEEKLDTITEKLNETNIILSENTKSLIIHEKRTDLAEKKMELLERKLDNKSEKDSTILEGLRDHVRLVNLTLKYIIPSIGAILLFLYKLGILKY